ncbi:MAG: ABC transporter permease [Anaerolineales bacterium]
MNQLIQALRVEILKARRSKMPLITLLGFSLVPFVAGFFMIIIRDPEMARRMGIISTKAQIIAGNADWPTFLDVITQATAIGGVILFSFIASWVFGREYSDRTISDLLALPTPRSFIVLAKFILVFLWSALLIVIIFLIGLGVGAAIHLPYSSIDVIFQGTQTLAVTALLTAALAAPVAFVACAGRGYLAPMGFAIFMVILAQIIAAVGWGEYFAWSIPALYAGMAGPAYAELGVPSFAILILTSILGVLGTFAWWSFADQT